MNIRYSPTDIYTASNTALSGFATVAQIFNVSQFAFWAVASITQLLSTFGIANDINLMVWRYGGEFDFLLTLVFMGTMWYFKS